jgi:hypothetical protein
MTAGWFQPRRADVSSMLPVRLSCAVERASAGSLGNSERHTEAVTRSVTSAVSVRSAPSHIGRMRYAAVRFSGPTATGRVT